jgi:hypothetical protein
MVAVMSLLLIGAGASLLGWAVLTFLSPVTSGGIHLLLAVGTTLLVAWWALRE